MTELLSVEAQERMNLPLALDAMGGDFAPQNIVQGAVEYARETGRSVLLVGRPDEVQKSLDAVKGPVAKVEIVPASEVIGFEDKIASIRSKRDSSIHVGARLVRDGAACGFVSAGHTGAVRAISQVIFGLLDGVEVSALPAPLPRVSSGYTVVVDAGASLDCKPVHLRQFAVMGFHYVRHLLGVPHPKVALLNIGGEDTKGNKVLKETAAMLRDLPINYVGNVEGNDLMLTDKADVVVCDGFTGNVALKVAEGTAEAIAKMIREQAERSFWRQLGGLLMRPAFQALRRRTDYAEVGGVPLLGLRQVSVVAHGRSTPRAIYKALCAADAAVNAQIIERIARELPGVGEAEHQLAERIC